MQVVHLTLRNSIYYYLSQTNMVVSILKVWSCKVNVLNVSNTHHLFYCPYLIANNSLVFKEQPAVFICPVSLLCVVYGGQPVQLYKGNFKRLSP